VGEGYHAMEGKYQTVREEATERQAVYHVTLRTEQLGRQLPPHNLINPFVPSFEILIASIVPPFITDTDHFERSLRYSLVVQNRLRITKYSYRAIVTVSTFLTPSTSSIPGQIPLVT